MGAFVTYHQVAYDGGDYHEIAAIYGSQANANDGAYPGVIAYVGELASFSTQKGYYINPDDGTVTPFPPQHPLRVAIRALHDSGVTLEEIGNRVALGFPDTARAKFHDYLFEARAFTYLLAHSPLFSAVQKIQWAAEVAKGSADILVTAAGLEDVALRFFHRVKTLTAPTVPSSWVNPADAAKVNIDALVTIAGTVPDTVNLATGDWIATFAIPDDPAPPSE